MQNINTRKCIIFIKIESSLIRRVAKRQRERHTHRTFNSTGDQTEEFTYAGPVFIYGIVPQPDIWKINTPLFKKKKTDKKQQKIV